MCQYSVIMQRKYDEWGERYWVQPPLEPYEFPKPKVGIPTPTQEELDKFKKELEDAKSYDIETNQPDCEDSRKKKLLKEMAEALGVEISFP